MIKGFKGYRHGLKCIDKQYEVGKTYTEDGNNICASGMMHFCENPEDVLGYYSACGKIRVGGELTEFTEVEAPEEESIPTCDNGLHFPMDSKVGTRKLTIKDKIPFRKFISKCIKGIANKAGVVKIDDNTLVDENMHSYYYVTKGADDVVFDNMNSRISTDTNNSRIVSKGNGCKIYADGKRSGIVSLGRCDEAVNVGTGGSAICTGSGAQAVCNGMASSSITTNNDSVSYTDGDYSASITHGWDSTAIAKGRHSIAIATGKDSTAKASLHSWLVLTEWKHKKIRKDYRCWYIADVKAVYVDGKDIKPDVEYALVDGKVVEADSMKNDRPGTAGSFLGLV